MRFNARVKNTEKVVFELQQIGERVVDNARKTMHARARHIAREAKLNAPVDDHDLEESIHIERDTGENGRLELTITAGGTVNGVDVDDYATLIHENYESMQPGENTLAKRAANPGRYVGGKFLERAALQEEETLMKRLVAVIRRVVPK